VGADWFLAQVGGECGPDLDDNGAAGAAPVRREHPAAVDQLDGAVSVVELARVEARSGRDGGDERAPGVDGVRLGVARAGVGKRMRLDDVARHGVTSFVDSRSLWLGARAGLTRAPVVLAS